MNQEKKQQDLDRARIAQEKFAAIIPEILKDLQDREQEIQIERVQSGLARLGYNPGPADGVLGPKTHRAIRAFEVDHGLRVTGEVSDHLDRRILSARVARAEARAESDPEPVATILQLVKTASGFAVSAEGHLLTNNHVVRDCSEVLTTSTNRAPSGCLSDVRSVFARTATSAACRRTNDSSYGAG